MPRGDGTPEWLVPSQCSSAMAGLSCPRPSTDRAKQGSARA
jgi:hypothetical protein